MESSVGIGRTLRREGRSALHPRPVPAVQVPWIFGGLMRKHRVFRAYDFFWSLSLKKLVNMFWQVFASCHAHRAP